MERILEVFFQRYPILHFTAWTGIAGVCFARSVLIGQLETSTVLAVGALAYCSWMVFEYAVHRWVYHLRLPGRWGKKLIYALHGHHHSNPTELTGALAPTIPSLLVGAALFYFYRQVFGAAFTETFFAFTAAIYISYECFHVALHAYSSKNRSLSTIKKFHMSHHYRDASMNFGVTSALVDEALQTALEKPAAQNVRTWEAA